MVLLVSSLKFFFGSSLPEEAVAQVLYAGHSGLRVHAPSFAKD